MADARAIVVAVEDTKTSLVALLGGILCFGAPLAGFVLERGPLSIAKLVFFSIFWVLGLALAYGALATMTRRVRIALAGDEVVVTWRRFGRAMKVETFARGELVDVGVVSRPSDGDSIFGAVLGSKRGDVALTVAPSVDRAKALRASRALAAFLDLPER